MIIISINRKLLLVSILLCNCLVGCFWPPPYSIHLTHNEKFVFLTDMGEFESDEEEMEMLKEDYICGLNLNVDDDKMEMLHKHFNPSNATPMQGDYPHYTDIDYVDLLTNIRKRDVEEPLVPIPYSSQLIVNGKIVEKRMLINDTTILPNDITVPPAAAQTNDTPSSTSDTPASTSDTTQVNDDDSGLNSDDPDYDYAQLKAEYDVDMELAISDNATYNYTEIEKPEDTMKDSFEKLIDFKKPRNCTKEEAENFGIKAVECLVDEYGHVHTQKTKKELFRKSVKIINIWLIIYCIIAIPLYCRYGWCCCWFCCWSLCRPKKIILDTKTYAARNPPGVLIRENGKEFEYTPSEYEIEAYDDLMYYIRCL